MDPSIGSGPIAPGGVGGCRPFGWEVRALSSVAPLCEPRRARVLVIDDEAAICRAYARVLSYRFDVVTATGGPEALELLARDADFDVVICDLMMPGVDGPQIHEALVEQAPRLAERLVFSSGGVFTKRARAFVESVESIFLDKPVRPRDLIALVERFAG